MTLYDCPQVVNDIGRNGASWAPPPTIVNKPNITPKTLCLSSEVAQVGYIGEGRFVRGSARSAVPVAVTGIFLGAKAPCQLPTAATRSIPFFRHRRRSCRSPFAGFFVSFLAGARKEGLLQYKHWRAAQFAARLFFKGFSITASGRPLPVPCRHRCRCTSQSSTRSGLPDPLPSSPTQQHQHRCRGDPGWRGSRREVRWALPDRTGGSSWSQPSGYRRSGWRR